MAEIVLRVLHTKDGRNKTESFVTSSGNTYFDLLGCLPATEYRISPEIRLPGGNTFSVSPEIRHPGGNTFSEGLRLAVKTRK